MALTPAVRGGAASKSITLLVNGERRELTVEAGGQTVETVEGLQAGEGLHPLQAAFIEHDAVQCGICIPGMLMSVKALLDRTLTPAEADVREAIAGNLCRCGTYPNTVKATMAAARALRERAQRGA